MSISASGCIIAHFGDSSRRKSSLWVALTLDLRSNTSLTLWPVLVALDSSSPEEVGRSVDVEQISIKQHSLARKAAILGLRTTYACSLGRPPRPRPRSLRSGLVGHDGSITWKAKRLWQNVADIEDFELLEVELC